MKKKIYKKNNHQKRKIIFYNTSTKHSNDENSFSTIDTKISDSTNETKRKKYSKKTKKYYSKTFLTNCDCYKGLSMNEKIYEMNNLHNSSEKRFKKYYGIFEQIKSEINDIQKNLNFSKTNYKKKKFKCLTNVNSNNKYKKHLNDIEEKDEEYFISPEKKNNDSKSNFDNFDDDEKNNQIINLINKFDQDDFNDMLNNDNNNNNLINLDKDFYNKIYNNNTNNTNNSIFTNSNKFYNIDTNKTNKTNNSIFTNSIKIYNNDTNKTNKTNNINNSNFANKFYNNDTNKTNNTNNNKIYNNNTKKTNNTNTTNTTNNTNNNNNKEKKDKLSSKKMNNYYYSQKKKQNKNNYFESDNSDKENNNDNNISNNNSEYCDYNVTDTNENKKEIFISLTTESDSMKNCQSRNKILIDKYYFNKSKTIFVEEDDNYNKNNKYNNNFCGCLCQ